MRNAKPIINIAINPVRSFPSQKQINHKIFTSKIKVVAHSEKANQEMFSLANPVCHNSSHLVYAPYEPFS